jgi:hypothetical protein
MSRAILRFWWLAAAGVVVGIAVAAWMVYELPGFTPRNAPVWTATARLFVTSAEGQYVRVSVPRSLETPSSAASGESGAAGGGGSGGGGGPLVVNEPPNVQPLLTAANLYPLLIESDDVARLREERYGELPGTVVASAYSAVSTPQRFSPAQLPVIDIFATSDTSRQAVALADATAETFNRWVRREQDRAGLKPEERILIRELQAPGPTFPSGGPAYGIPVLVAFALIAGFGMLAVVLDQIVPGGATAPRTRPQSETS